MLRLLALEMGVRVREDEDTMIPVDRAELRANVAGQASVPDWMHITGSYALTDFEASIHGDLPAR